MITREEARRLIEQSLVEIAPLGRHQLAEAICEARKLFCKTSQVSVKGICVAPAPYRYAQKRIVPPRGMEARLRKHDVLALCERRRQRPLGGDKVRIRQVFEQQMPRTSVRGLDGFKTARHQPSRH